MVGIQGQELSPARLVQRGGDNTRLVLICAPCSKRRWLWKEEAWSALTDVPPAWAPIEHTSGASAILDAIVSMLGEANAPVELDERLVTWRELAALATEPVGQDPAFVARTVGEVVRIEALLRKLGITHCRMLEKGSRIVVTVAGKRHPWLARLRALGPPPTRPA